MNIRHLLAVVIAGVAAVTAIGCAGAMQRMAADQTAAIFDRSAVVFQQETDVAIARAAAPGNLKMIEGLLVVRPDDERLLRLASRGWFEYAFAFIEGDLESLDESAPAWDATRERAANLYARSRRFAMHWLELRRADIARAIEQGSVDALRAALAGAERDDAEVLLWVAQPWGASIQLRLDDPEALMEVPLVEALMQRVVELDESVYYGAAHLFLGALYASVPADLGGNAARAKEHFDRARALAPKGDLLPRVLYARYYLAGIGADRAAFEKTLREVIDADPDAAGPERALSNRIAQARARVWLAQASTRFF